MSPVHNKDGGTANETMLPRVNAWLGQITLRVCHNSHWGGKWEPLGYINDSRPTIDVKKNLNKFTRSLKILYTNADTLTNKLDELNILIFSMQEQELQIDGYSFLSNIPKAKEKSVTGILHISKKIIM